MPTLSRPPILPAQPCRIAFSVVDITVSDIYDAGFHDRADAVWRLFGVGLALEQFRSGLDDLIERIEELSSGRERDVTG